MIEVKQKGAEPPIEKKTEVIQPPKEERRPNTAVVSETEKRQMHSLSRQIRQFRKRRQKRRRRFLQKRRMSRLLLIN